MVAVDQTTYQINRGIRFVNSDGRLTGQGYRLMAAIAKIVNSITIEDGEVTTDKIAANAVTAAKIEANTITADEISVKSLDADEILVDGTIITDLIGSGAVSLSASASIDTNQTTNNDTHELISVTTGAVGERVQVMFATLFGSSNGDNATFTMKRDGTTVSTLTVSTINNSAFRGIYLNMPYIDESPGDEYTVEVTNGAGENATNSSRRIYVLNVKR